MFIFIYSLSILSESENLTAQSIYHIITRAPVFIEVSKAGSASKKQSCSMIYTAIASAEGIYALLFGKAQALQLLHFLITSRI